MFIRMHTHHTIRLLCSDTRAIIKAHTTINNNPYHPTDDPFSCSRNSRRNFKKHNKHTTILPSCWEIQQQNTPCTIHIIAMSAHRCACTRTMYTRTFNSHENNCTAPTDKHPNSNTTTIHPANHDVCFVRMLQKFLIC